MGPIGLFANIILLVWTTFTLIMYSFPPLYPATPSSKSIGLFASPINQLIFPDMNYVSAVYFVVVVIIIVDWFTRGKKGYRGQDKRHEQVGHLGNEGVNMGGGCGI